MAGKIKIFFERFFGGFKSLLLILAVGIGLFLHFYTEHIIKQLRDESRSLVLFYAQMYARVAEMESSSDLSFIFEQIILRTNFPLIQTDANKKPIGWKGISIDPDDRSPEALEKVRQMVNRLDKEIDPIPVKYGDVLLAYLYFSDSRLIRQLVWLPYVEVGIVGLFILIGFIGFANIKRSEQRHIWVGMAKETAHQLGTPLSSLMGWLEVLRSDNGPDPEQISNEMERDLQRLRQVTQRFSKIGSKPNLMKASLSDILSEAVEYIRRRAPYLGKKVEVKEKYGNVPPVALNPDLFQWVVENLMKNSLDAMDKNKGEIAVRTGTDENKRFAFVEIADNGKGVDSSRFKKIFKPGYSEKKRGWGLGLALAKRIIEEYHRGRLFVKESRVGEGTVMRIELRC